MKYNVSYDELAYYLTTEIEAKNEDEAREKFTEMLNNGDIEVMETEEADLRIEEIKD